MANQYTQAEIYSMKGNIILAKAYATFSYVLAAGAAVSALFVDSPVSALVLTAFGTAAAIKNGLSAERLEDNLKATERNSLEAKLKAKRESEMLEDRAILSSSKCEIKYKYK